MEGNLISIIVPIYNVDKYLNQCLESIKKQTYRNLEIILVDDGSTDNSSKICLKFVKDDNRFLYFHKENGGLSSARNYGFNCAGGDYICFIDSDDFISENYISDLYSEFVQTGIDIVICDYLIFDEKKNRFYGHKNKALITTKIYDSKNKNELLEDLFRNKSYFMPVWKNMYRTSFLKQYKLSFVSEREVYTEDQVFNLAAYYSANKIVCIDKPLFYHRIVSGSLSQGYRENLPLMIEKRYEVIKEFLHKNNTDSLLVCYEKEFKLIVIDLYIMMCRTNIKQAISNVKAIMKNTLFNFALSQKCKVEDKKYKFVYFIVKTRSPFIICSIIKSLLVIKRLLRRG